MREVAFKDFATVKEKKAVQEIAREYIEKHIDPILKAYGQLAGGRIVNKWHEGKIVGQDFEVDSAVLRHYIDRLLPPAKTTVDVNLNSPDEFLRAIDEAKKR